MREVVAECERPVMLYSIGKDSAVMLHLAMKAFYPSKPPFPLLHVDTTWKFREMIDFRDRRAKELGLELLDYINPKGIEMNINPFVHGSKLHTEIMKTEALKQALDKWQIRRGLRRRAPRRGESRAPRSACSPSAPRSIAGTPRTSGPSSGVSTIRAKAPGESLRVFPLSNWTEADIWDYIARENIPVVPLYFAKERPVVRRERHADHGRRRSHEAACPAKSIEHKMVRFRTLGCYPLTGANRERRRRLSTRSSRKCAKAAPPSARAA